MPATVASTFLAFAVTRLRTSQRNIARCCDQLTEDQMWHRAAEHENSIANLLIHLSGNLRQWVLHGIAGQPDVRTRDAEFALTPTMDSRAARELFDTTLDEVCAVLTTLDESRLLDVIDPQPNGTWRHLPILEAIFQVTAHVSEHMGQIVLLTKQQTGRDLDLTMPRKR